MALYTKMIKQYLREVIHSMKDGTIGFVVVVLLLGILILPT